MVSDHVMVGPVGENPTALARGIAGHPGMYMGGPATFERAVAFVYGVEMALIATDRQSPLTKEDHRLLQERPCAGRPPDQELADIRRLEPLLTKLLSALTKGMQDL